MKKVLITGIFFVLPIVISPSAGLAAAGCPLTADRLEDFAPCLVRTANGAALARGSRYSVHLGGDHRELLNAMAADSGVPPQVMPPSTPIINAPFMPSYYPYPLYPVTGASVWMYTGYGINPGVMIRYQIPLY